MSIALLVLQWPGMKKEAELEVVSAIEEEETRTTPIINYLENDILPEDHGESRKIRREAARYCISQRKLYRRSFSGPYLRCLTPREAARILVELHEGECGSHSSSQILHFPREIILKVLSRPYLRCLTAREAAKILVYASHTNGRSLVLRARRAGYY